MPELTPTRSVYLELREERIGMEEGYRFLDEKRLVLAAEILRQLERYESMMEEFTRLYREAAVALQGAVLRHGLSGLQTCPATATNWGDAQRERRSVLGLEVQEVHVAEGESEAMEPAVNASPEAAATGAKFARLIPHAASLAAMTANLVKLREEYQLTSRRARALEDVLLPEIDRTLAQIDIALEEMDKEEIVRVHYGMASDGHGGRGGS